MGSSIKLDDETSDNWVLKGSRFNKKRMTCFVEILLKVKETFFHSC